MKALIINSTVDSMPKEAFDMMNKTISIFSNYDIAEYGIAALQALLSKNYDVLIMESAFRWEKSSDIIDEAGYKMIKCINTIDIKIPILVYSFYKNVDYVGIDCNKNIKGYFTRKSKNENGEASNPFLIYPELENFINKIFYNEAVTREDKVKKLIDKINGEIENLSKFSNETAERLTHYVLVGGPGHIKDQLQEFKRLILLNHWREFINDYDFIKTFTKMADISFYSDHDCYIIPDEIIERLQNVKNITNYIFDKGYENMQISDQYLKSIFFNILLVTYEDEEDV